MPIHKCSNISANNYNTNSTNSTRNNNLPLWSCWQPLLITIHWQPQLATTLISKNSNQIRSPISAFPKFDNVYSCISPFDNVCSCISLPLTTKTKGSLETPLELGTLSKSQPTDIQSIQPHFWYQLKWAIYHTLTVKSKLGNWNFVGMIHKNTNWNWHLWHL